MTDPANRFVIISGCSGGGKSSLLAELRRRGHATVDEPGRRIVAEELAGSGAALPWVDPEAFAERAIAIALEDRAAAAALPGRVFFDRGLIDAAAALEHASGRPALAACAGERCHPTVFMAPPWPEIYATDSERRHGFEEAVAEYERLLTAFEALGYQVCVLPKVSVADRADFVLDRLGAG
jgi:predicted ATPase